MLAAQFDLAGITQPAAAQSLPGHYRAPAAGNPFVLTTQARMAALLSAHTPTTQAALGLLEHSVRALVQRQNDFLAVDTGCDIDATMRAFSIVPNGAAPAAAKLALYGYLASQQAGYGDPSLAREAREAATTIVTRWATDGFKLQGEPIKDLHSFCGKGRPEKVTWSLVGLQVGRGMVYYVDAVDLLTAQGALTSAQTGDVHSFMARQLALMVPAMNYHVTSNTLDCARFDNQTSMQILSVLSLARMLGRRDLVEGLAGQGSHGLAVTFPAQIAGAIYGATDTVRSCFAPNTASSKYYFQTGQVAPGEIVDRFRAAPYQSFGYTTGSLTTLLLAARIFDDSGFAASAYHAPGGQGLQSALDYYSYYYATFLSTNKAAVPAGQSSYPDYAQYAGAMITRDHAATPEDRDNGLTSFLLGDVFFPKDQKVQQVIKKASSFPGVVPFWGVDTLAIDALPVLGRTH